jgi:hypothetical protein
MSADPQNRASRVAKYLEGIPVSTRGVISRALAGAGSPRGAIKAKCLHCSNWQRDEITHCRVFTCPLHPWRPFQPKVAAEDQPAPQP